MQALFLPTYLLKCSLGKSTVTDNIDTDRKKGNRRTSERQTKNQKAEWHEILSCGNRELFIYILPCSKNRRVAHNLTFSQGLRTAVMKIG